MAGYLGNIPTPQATQTRDTFTATSGQTSFATSGYTVGMLDIYLNGIKLASADLSNFEKNILRNVFLFYSFIRKNQVQVFRTLVKNPSRVIGQLRMIKNSQQEHLGERNLNSVPDWMRLRYFLFGRDPDSYE